MPIVIGDAAVTSASKPSATTNEPTDTTKSSPKERGNYPIILHGSCETCGTTIVIGEGIEQYQCLNCSDYEDYEGRE